MPPYMSWSVLCLGILVMSVCRVSLRLALLFQYMIAWTSGEAYIQGPQPPAAQSRRRRKSTARIDDKPHVNDVRYRFHNVQGMSDRRFRGLYLERARATCDVLAVAEANWSTDEEARAWCADWTRSSGVEWALGRAQARGMGIFFADSLGDVAAKVLWQDDLEGRGLAVQATIHGRTTVIVAFHADVTGGDDVQERSYTRLLQHVPVVRDAEYIWMVDANNVVDPRVDSWQSDDRPPAQTHAGGVRGLCGCLSAWGWLVDAYRHLHPDGRDCTHRQHVGATPQRSDYYV